MPAAKYLINLGSSRCCQWHAPHATFRVQSIEWRCIPCLNLCMCRVAGLAGTEVASLLSLRAKLQEEGLPPEQLLQAYTDAKAQVGDAG